MMRRTRFQRDQAAFRFWREAPQLPLSLAVIMVTCVTAMWWVLLAPKAAQKSGMRRSQGRAARAQPLLASRTPGSGGTRGTFGHSVRGTLGSIHSLAILYLTAIFLAELVTAIVDPFWGFIAHLGILSLLLLDATFSPSPDGRSFFLALCIAPMIRIVSLGMPLGQFDQQWWYVLSAAPLFAACVVVMRAVPLTPQQIGLRLPGLRYWRISVLVALSGLPLGLMEYLVLRPEPIVEEYTAGGFLLTFIILLIGTGLIEELVFRGILQSTATAVLGGWPGIIFVSLLFGVLHVGHLSVLDVVFVFGVALYFAEVVRRTRSLVAVTIAHGLTNFMLFVVLPTIANV